MMETQTVNEDTQARAWAGMMAEQQDEQPEPGQFPSVASNRAKRYHKRTREQFNALQELDKQSRKAAGVETPGHSRNSSLDKPPQKRICTDPRPGTDQGASTYRLVLKANQLDRQLDHKVLHGVDPAQHPPRYPFVNTPFTVDIALMHSEKLSFSQATQVNGVAMVTLLYQNGEPADPGYLVLEDPDPNPPAQRTDVPWSPTNPGVLPVVGGALQFRCAINRMSAEEAGRRFILRMTLGGSAGVSAVPLDIGPFEVVRYRLQIAKQPDTYFFKDQGGQRHGLTAYYQLVEARGPSGCPPPLPEEIKLKVGLVYEDLKPLDISDAPGDILLSPKSQKRGHKRALTHTIMDGRTRKGSIKYRIEECSSVNHKNRAFRFTIALDEDNPRLQGVAPCFTRKTHVMAKDLWKEKLKKACKLYRWDEAQCHMIHEDYQRQQSHSSAKPDPYNRWRTPEEVRAWMVSGEGKAFSNTSHGHRKTHSRLRGNPTRLPPLPLPGSWQGMKTEDGPLPPQVRVKREDMMGGHPSAMTHAMRPYMVAPLSAMSISDHPGPYGDHARRAAAMSSPQRGHPMSGIEERAYNRIRNMMGSAQKIAARLAKEGYTITPQSVLPVLLEDVATQRNSDAQRSLAMQCLREDAILENPREYNGPPVRFSVHGCSNPPSECHSPDMGSRKSSIESAPSHKSSIDSAPSRKSSVEEGVREEEDCFPATRQDRSMEQSAPPEISVLQSYPVGCLPPLPVFGTPLLSTYTNAVYPPQAASKMVPRMGNLGGKLGGLAPHSNDV